MAMLYDHLGRPVKTGDLQRELAGPTLAGIRTVWDQTAASGLTPYALAGLLAEAAAGDATSYLTLAEEMEERDLHYRCELGKRRLAVTRLEATVEAASDDPKDEELADQVREFTRRDGSIVHDPRLGRLVSPDSEQQRCAAYPLRTEPDRKPIHKVWTVPYLLDQWYSPMCVGFAVAHRLISAGLKLGRRDAERIYREAQKYDLFPGEGYAGTTIIGGACAAYQLGYVKRFSWASTLDDLILGVGHSGPAIMGTKWYKAMDSPAINGGVRPEGRNNGGHAYLIYGVVPEGRLFLCANSWGEWYGIQGMFVMNFDDMERLLMDKGDACFFDEVVT